MIVFVSYIWRSVELVYALSKVLKLSYISQWKTLEDREQQQLTIPTANCSCACMTIYLLKQIYTVYFSINLLKYWVKLLRAHKYVHIYCKIFYFLNIVIESKCVCEHCKRAWKYTSSLCLLLELWRNLSRRYPM